MLNKSLIVSGQLPFSPRTNPDESHGPLQISDTSSDPLPRVLRARVCVREIIKEICSVLSAVDKILTLAASLCVGGVLKYKYTPGSALVATELKPSFN